MQLALKAFKATALSLLAFMATILTVILSGPILKFIRKSYGSIYYWTIGSVFVASLYFSNFYFPFIYVSTIWMTLGIYTELEIKKFNWKISSVVSIVLGLIFSGISSWIVTTKLGFNSLVEVRNAAQKLIEQIQVINPESEIKLDATALTELAPSNVIILLIFSLLFGAVLEKFVFNLFNGKFYEIKSDFKFVNFKNPDFLIWISLVSLLVTLLINKEQHSVAVIISENIVRVASVLYLIQGLAVTTFIFVSLRLSFVMRILGYILLIGPFILFIGFIDYWMDFRKKGLKLNPFSKSTREE